VKVSLLCEDGSARSLKAGKLNRTITQLTAYREFGSPDVSLLDIYLCEAGFMSHNIFLPPAAKDSITAKVAELSQNGFGYQLLPFEHGKNGDVDIGLKAMAPNPSNPLQTTFNILPAFPFRPRDPFALLADRIDHFFEQSPDRSHSHLKQIVFCRECRMLQLIKMKEEHICPNCKSDLIIQS